MQSKPSNLGRRYLLTVLAFRVVAMALVAISIPLAHIATSAFYHRDGPQQFGMMIMSFAGGFVAALIYLIISTIAHFVVWRRSMRTKFWVEGLVLSLFIFVVVYENL